MYERTCTCLMNKIVTLSRFGECVSERALFGEYNCNSE